MNKAYFLEPINFFLNKKLLSGWNSDGAGKEFEIVRALDRAMMLESSQDLPDGYRIWSDYFPNAVAPWYTTVRGRNGRQIADEQGAIVWNQLGSFQAELGRKRIRNTITAFEEFWSVTAFDILEHLKMVAVGRFYKADYDNSKLEEVFRIYQYGLYPCGQKSDGRLVAFDPKVLNR